MNKVVGLTFVCVSSISYLDYRKISNISRTKSQNLDIFLLVL